MSEMLAKITSCGCVGFLNKASSGEAPPAPSKEADIVRRLSGLQTVGYSSFQFDASAKATTFGKVFDVGRPMWVKLGELVEPQLSSAAKKDPAKMTILSLGDGPGEPGCYLAAKFKCPTTTSDMVPPMVEAAKKRVEKQESEGKLQPGQVKAEVIDMQDLKSVASGSVDLVSSAHAHPFAPDQAKALAESFRVLKSGGVFGAVAWKSFA